MAQSNHITVFKNEAVAALSVIAGNWYLDATFGGGGHTAAILAQGGNVIALDFDAEAIMRGQQIFAQELAAGSLRLLRENFTEISTVVREHTMQLGMQNGLAGVLFDFGTSTDQLMSSDRGFSFTGDGELDMRMDTRLGVTAADLLSAIPEKQLAQLFIEYGGEPDAKKIAKAIKNSSEKITTTKQLVAVIAEVKGQRRGPLHPATKVFQALRIATNTELDNIRQALPQALDAVMTGGSIVSIAFHEGEDEIVKTQFALWEKANKVSSTKKPLAPSQEEVRENPRSRSARLRVAKKL